MCEDPQKLKAELFEVVPIAQMKSWFWDSQRASDWYIKSNQKCVSVLVNRGCVVEKMIWIVVIQMLCCIES